MASICNQRRPMVLAVVLLLVAFAHMCQGQTLPEASELVERYREAVSRWDQRVSMRIHSEIDATGSDPGDRWAKYTELNLIHRRDGNRAEWIGSKSFFEDNKAEVCTSSREFVAIGNGKDIVAADDSRTPDETYEGTIRRQSYEKILRSALEDYYYGGFLHGVGVMGRLAANLGEFLSRYDTLRVIGKDNIDGTGCYKVEAKTENGTVTVWIAPEKGYNALKVSWVIHDNDFLRDGLYLKDSSLAEWSVLIDSIEVEKIDGIFVPVSGRFTRVSTRKDGVERTVCVKVKRSQIDLNPDFEALGAFRLALPDGSHIYDRDSGISYQVFGGELVPNVDEAVIEQIDKMTEEIMAEGKVPPGLATAEKTKVTPNEPPAAADTPPEVEVDMPESQQEVLSESRSLPVLVLVLFGLSIIGVIGWVVFRRLKA